MNNFLITTESSCDLSKARIEKLNIKQISFKVLIDDTEYDSAELSPKDFYEALRAGKTAKTSAINSANYSQFFEEGLKNGKDVLHIALSSGLSASYSCACFAAEELRKKYPERRIEIIDSIGGSLGQGLLAELCSKQRSLGKDIEKTAELARALAPKICHIFTVSDLAHLKRGGRISGTVACVGTLLNIKPVLKANNEGKLEAAGKIRGKAAAINHLAKTFFSTQDRAYANTPIFISHADCLDDAKALAEALRKNLGQREIYINDIGALMGAHCGPDTLALFYVCLER